MKVKYKSEDGRIEAVISEQADWELFNSIADSISERFTVRWVEKLDGLEQRYWDFEMGGVRLTLHLEHYLGITLSPSDANCETANDSVKRIGDWFQEKGGGGV